MYKLWPGHIRMDASTLTHAQTKLKLEQLYLAHHKWAGQKCERLLDSVDPEDIVCLEQWNICQWTKST